MKETEFYKIVNADGKCWLMPMRNLRMGLALYQPSGWKGRLLKRWFPYVHWSKLVRKVLKIEVVEHVLEADLRGVICSAFGVGGFEYSVFEGTPSVHQKTIIQVWRGERILGYVKLTESEEVGRLFSHEKSVLDELINKNVDGIPYCLFCEAIKGRYVFLQNTLKTISSKINHNVTIKQLLFLQQLCNSTKKKILYKESDFFKSIDYLLCLENKIPISDFNNIKLAYNIINNYFSREKYDGYVEFSVYHGDFTPWNMFEEKGKLFVFDWEYVSLTYPPFLDIFHYIIQIALLEKKLDIQSVFRYYDEQKKILSTFFNDIDFLLLCYLMNIISFYFKLNDGDLSLNDRCYIKWIKLLDGILKRL